MNNPLTAISDKVVRMMNAMVYLATGASPGDGATTGDIVRSLGHLAPVHADIYHQGMVERSLRDLQQQGLVVRSGSRWHRI